MAYTILKLELTICRQPKSVPTKSGAPELVFDRTTFATKDRKISFRALVKMLFDLLNTCTRFIYIFTNLNSFVKFHEDTNREAH